MTQTHMDNIRLVLFFALAFVLLLLYQAWMQDYGTVSTKLSKDSDEATAEPVKSMDPSESVPSVTIDADETATALINLPPYFHRNSSL